MSYDDGWAALRLEMPRRVPRTEYSATMHWDLVRHVTGIEVDYRSTGDVQHRAAIAFERAWNYDFRWSTAIGGGEFKEKKTDMGHAEYAAGGVDRRDTVRCPYDDPEAVLSFDFDKELGHRSEAELVAEFERSYRGNCAANADAVNMTGVYITLISGFTDLFGWEMQLLAAGTDLERFGDLANRYAAWIGRYFAALAKADVPVVMVHDDMVWTQGAIYSPEWYRRFVFPNYKRLFAPILDSGKRLVFCSDGNFSAFIDDLAGTGVNGFVMEPTTDMKYIAEKYGRTHVFIGNADTRILLSGSRAEIRAEVERCMCIGKRCPGFFMAVGNHIPPNTPVESALYYNQVYEELSGR